MNDLEQVKRSLVYTEATIKYLNDAIPNFAQQSFQTKRFNLLNEIDEIRVRQIAEVSYDVHFYVSAVIHEIRSCLDRFACVLAVRNGKTTRDVYFPIFRLLKS